MNEVDVAQCMVSASEFKSEDPWVPSPGWGRVRSSFSYPSKSTLVRTYLCLTPISCARPRTQMRAHVKDSISIYRKSVGLVRFKHKNTAHRRKNPKNKSWVERYYGNWFSPRGNSPNFPFIAFGTRQSYRM